MHHPVNTVINLQVDLGQNRSACYYLIKAMRPGQWLKNVVVFAGLVFSGNLFDLLLFLQSMAGLLTFLLLSAGVYLINDVKDLKSDRVHPEKRFRPIAAGHVSVTTAIITAILLTGIALVVSFSMSLYAGIIASAYFILMVGYSHGLKNIVILDVCIIATGFIIRAIAGAVMIHVEISPWLLICTTFLALLLALGKRHQELLLLGAKARCHRSNLSDYSLQLLEHLMTIVTGLTIISYVLYTLAPRTLAVFGTCQLVYTVPCVLFAVFRYLFLVHQKNLGGQPEVMVFSDKPIICCVLLWLGACGWIIYLS